ncbi:MAG: hypothetical protein M3Y72_24540 [Acidobacteriota bacterium]|nr:hypothetical protein [Acidobacteriota bacterium]
MYDRLTFLDPDYIPRRVVYAALRANLPYFGLACIVLIAGISSLLLTRLKYRDSLLVWSGIFSVMYGARLLMQNELVRAAFNVPGQELYEWARCLTYAIPIPYALFARKLFGPGWKGSIAIWSWIQIAFALTATPIALFAHQVHWTDLVNGILVIAGSLLILLHVLLRRERGSRLRHLLRGP